MLQPRQSAKRGNDINPQPLSAAEHPDALLRLPTAGALMGVGTQTIYRRAKDDPTFPPLIRIGARCTRIRAGDLTAWMQAQAANAGA